MVLCFLVVAQAKNRKQSSSHLRRILWIQREGPVLYSESHLQKYLYAYLYNATHRTCVSQISIFLCLLESNIVEKIKEHKVARLPIIYLFSADIYETVGIWIEKAKRRCEQLTKMQPLWIFLNEKEIDK